MALAVSTAKSGPLALKPMEKMMAEVVNKRRVAKKADKAEDAAPKTKAKKSKASESENPTVHFRQIKETKGAVQYTETDHTGKPIDIANAKIGSLYLRKSFLKDIGQDPQKFISVTLNLE